MGIDFSRDKDRRVRNVTARTLYKVAHGPNAQRHSSFSASCDFSSNCENPVMINMRSDTTDKPTGGRSAPREVSYYARCRKCPACAKANAKQWAIRAAAEMELAPRTWFVTLTFRAEIHWIFERQAEKLGKTIFDVEFLEVQKMFKRMRKAGHAFRYLLATEAHQSGLPHFHLFIHENVNTPFTSRLLSGNQKEDLKPSFWHHGNVHCRLVPPDRAWARSWYLCKYLSKDPSARQRASIKYGGGRGGVSPPRMPTK